MRVDKGLKPNHTKQVWLINTMWNWDHYDLIMTVFLWSTSLSLFLVRRIYTAFRIKILEIRSKTKNVQTIKSYKNIADVNKLKIYIYLKKHAIESEFHSYSIKASNRCQSLFCRLVVISVTAWDFQSSFNVILSSANISI